MSSELNPPWTAAAGTSIRLPCPASIWLLGAAAQCSKPAGHVSDPADCMHRVVIEWTTDGKS